MRKRGTVPKAARENWTCDERLSGANEAVKIQYWRLESCTGHILKPSLTVYLATWRQQKQAVNSADLLMPESLWHHPQVYESGWYQPLPFWQYLSLLPNSGLIKNGQRGGAWVALRWLIWTSPPSYLCWHREARFTSRYWHELDCGIICVYSSFWCELGRGFICPM